MLFLSNYELACGWCCHEEEEFRSEDVTESRSIFAISGTLNKRSDEIQEANLLSLEGLYKEASRAYKESRNHMTFLITDVDELALTLHLQKYLI